MRNVVRDLQGIKETILGASLMVSAEMEAYLEALRVGEAEGQRVRDEIRERGESLSLREHQVNEREGLLLLRVAAA